MNIYINKHGKTSSTIENVDMNNIVEISLSNKFMSKDNNNSRLIHINSGSFIDNNESKYSDDDNNNNDDDNNNNNDDDNNNNDDDNNNNDDDNNSRNQISQYSGNNSNMGNCNVSERSSSEFIAIERRSSGETIIEKKPSEEINGENYTLVVDLLNIKGHNDIINESHKKRVENIERVMSVIKSKLYFSRYNNNNREELIAPNNTPDSNNGYNNIDNIVNDNIHINYNKVIKIINKFEKNNNPETNPETNPELLINQQIEIDIINKKIRDMEINKLLLENTKKSNLIPNKTNNSIFLHNILQISKLNNKPSSEVEENNNTDVNIVNSLFIKNIYKFIQKFILFFTNFPYIYKKSKIYPT